MGEIENSADNFLFMKHARKNANTKKLQGERVRWMDSFIRENKYIVHRSQCKLETKQNTEPRQTIYFLFALHEN